MRIYKVIVSTEDKKNNEDVYSIFVVGANAGVVEAIVETIIDPDMGTAVESISQSWGEVEYHPQPASSTKTTNN
jgi:hypothetical protein